MDQQPAVPELADDNDDDAEAGKSDQSVEKKDDQVDEANLKGGEIDHVGGEVNDEVDNPDQLNLN